MKHLLVEMALNVELCAKINIVSRNCSELLLDSIVAQTLSTRRSTLPHECKMNHYQELLQ